MEVYRQYFSDKLYRLGVPEQCPSEPPEDFLIFWDILPLSGPPPSVCLSVYLLQRDVRSHCVTLRNGTRFANFWPKQSDRTEANGPSIWLFVLKNAPPKAELNKGKRKPDFQYWGLDRHFGHISQNHFCKNRALLFNSLFCRFGDPRPLQPYQKKLQPPTQERD